LDLSHGTTATVMRIGVIGTGAIASRHLSALATLGQAEVVAHLATSQDKADAAARRNGGVGFSSLDAFVRQGRPDVVFVCVPPHRHGAIEDRLIDDGIPFLVEKPMSAGAEPAERIAERIAGCRPIVAVGYQWRALDHVAAARGALAGRDIRMIIGEYHVGTPTTPWWRRRAESGGQFVEQTCHLIDLARVFAGEAEVAAALGANFARTAFPDADIAGVSAALLRYRSGAVGVFSATAVLPKPASVGLRVVCDGLEVSITLSETIIFDADGTRAFPATENPYVRQNAGFLDAVATGDPARVYCSYSDALLTHRTCLEIAALIG
jgi:myo-inositol 2-dehydrogenase / D-chiro-inositol 1-dehydrogenase